VTVRGTWSVNTAPVVEPLTGMRRPRIRSARPPSLTLTATVSSPISPAGSGSAGTAISVQSAPVSSPTRPAISCNTGSGSVPDSSSAVTSAVARSHRSRRDAWSYRRASSTATAAAPAGDCTTISSPWVNGPPVGKADLPAAQWATRSGVMTAPPASGENHAPPDGTETRTDRSRRPGFIAHQKKAGRCRYRGLGRSAGPSITRGCRVVPIHAESVPPSPVVPTAGAALRWEPGMRPGRWPVRNVDAFPPGEGSVGCRAIPPVNGLPLPLTPRHTNRTKGDRTARRWDSRRGCTKAAETSRVQPPDSGGHDSGYCVGDVGEGWVPRSTFLHR
jgi:hypothetical protein